uniref:L-fucose kinase n=2 Tax=Parascaris univalens TaxID=6257 RepID=A0A914ZFT4_PARUN
MSNEAKAATRCFDEVQPFMWSLVCITTRNAEQRAAVESEVNWLWRCGAIRSERVIVVEDPCPDLGSGGSSLNALLVVTEHLCAQRGFSVLTEEVLLDSRILILHSGREYAMNRCGSAFMYLGSDTLTKEGIRVPRSLFVLQLSQLTTLAARFSYGIWICGSDAFWQVEGDIEVTSATKNEDHSLVVFTFNADASLATSSGVYRLNERCDVVGIDYCTTKYESCAKVPLVLTVIYMPVDTATTFLSLHSVYPLSSCTYYGIDNGSPGLQLSIFFDFILAAANGIKEEDFVNKGSPPLDERSMKARQILFDRFSNSDTHACFLNISKYHYFQPADEENAIKFWNISTGNERKNAKEIKNHIFLPALEDPSYSALSLEKCFELNRTHIFNKWLEEVGDVLREDRNYELMPIFHSMCLAGDQSSSVPLHLIDFLHRVAAEDGSFRVTDRALSSVADVLGLLSKRRGGLRSGPAANPAFAPALRLLQNETTIRDGIEAMYNELSNWLLTPEKLIRAARHYEAAAQIFTRRNVTQFCIKQLPILRYHSGHKRVVRACCACRVDIAGGWTDTPPITMQIEHTAVVNMAVTIDGRKPVECEIHPSVTTSGVFVKELDLCLSTPEQILDLSDKPSLPGSLICATILASGLVGPKDTSLGEAFRRFFDSDIIGIEISTYSSLPHGSGLGTSSILAATILAALWTLMGVSFNTNNIHHAVLLIEQYLTTGGGWQDQVGGATGGLKISHFSRQTEEILSEQLECDEHFVHEIESKLLLIYTGRTRLAKNLLQEVVRSWFSRDHHITETLHSLANNAEAAAKLIRRCIFPVAEVEQYYKDKKKMAPGSEPVFVRNLIEELRISGFIEVAWLAGAGGGGFLYVWLKDGVSKNLLEDYLRHSEAYRHLTVHSITVDFNPLVVEFV